MASGLTTTNVARELLIMRSPLTATIINAGFIFAAFLLSLPALALPTTRGWLKAHGWLVYISAILTLVIGLDIWYHTLKTRANLNDMWDQQAADIKSLLQAQFNCCGYISTAMFMQDSTCPNVAVAASKQGCVARFSDFANGFLNLIFTASFGFVALDAILLLCVGMVLKDRQEKQRYRHIDEKNGFGGL
ncbi:MAG: phospholipid scramblase 1 [Candelina mexicana]|nr:MAG: phospholipid scramblase 1 [Candelina mexicana]